MLNKSLLGFFALAAAALASVVLIASVLIASGCRDEKVVVSSDPRVTLTLDWRPEPEFGGFYQAKLQGAFKERNLDVEFVNGGSGAPTWQLVATGKTDFATTSSDQVLIARSQGADVVALFAVYQTSPQGIMAHQARGFTKLQDVFSQPGVLAAENNAWLKYLLSKFGKPAVEITGDTQGIGVFLAQGLLAAMLRH